MPSVRFELTMDAGLRDRIDVARGDVPRAAWIKRACEVALAGPVVSGTGSAAVTVTGAMQPGIRACPGCGAIVHADGSGGRHQRGCPKA